MPKPAEGEIKGYVAKGVLDNRFGNKHAGKEVMQAVRHGSDGAKHARTLYRIVAKAGQKAGWVVMQPLTGRTHQLRLHMQLLGTPLVGDPKYLTDRPAPIGLDKRLHLHAFSIRLPRPDQRDLFIKAPLDNSLIQSFASLGFEPNMPIEAFEL